tara:strand:+ start:1801 stop:1965 length:165 start_codon:yes stop_codon:yes gene_type:complete
MENLVGNTNPQSNASEKSRNSKFKDIEDAIQKAIDTEISKKNSTKKAFANHKSR